MRRRIQYSDQFQRDLNSAFNRIAEHNVVAAERFRDEVFTRVLEISETPILGHPRRDIPSDYLTFTVKNWVIIYAYDDERLAVTRLVHGARDFRNLF